MARISPLMAVPLVAFLGFAGMAGWALLRDDPTALPTALAEREAPPVGATTLPGKTQLTDEMLREPGVKLVNFWASWCPPCRAEHPTIAELAERIPVYGVNLKDPESNALAFLRDEGDSYHAIATDPRGRIAIDWGVSAPPETFIIDGQGRILYRFAGPLIRDDYANRFLPELEKAIAAEN
ncbi:DsbE family thiol:disulfide interchange protein [uncultured Paracoccus sp.]|uniref:DsbE family thiol:disulfide interchange protein n=1 Tax=uncultured Paracoccus sp. TaxID=189685 RepID=UPI0025D63905|nr:DsbE family thiol:disulfide interchange protein [uncultured Paracoccus sp.]